MRGQLEAACVDRDSFQGQLGTALAECGDLKGQLHKTLADHSSLQAQIVRWTSTTTEASLKQLGSSMTASRANWRQPCANSKEAVEQEARGAVLEHGPDIM